MPCVITLIEFCNLDIIIPLSWLNLFVLVHLHKDRFLLPVSNWIQNLVILLPVCTTLNFYSQFLFTYMYETTFKVSLSHLPKSAYIKGHWWGYEFHLVIVSSFYCLYLFKLLCLHNLKFFKVKFINCSITLLKTVNSICINTACNDAVATFLTWSFLISYFSYIFLGV